MEVKRCTAVYAGNVVFANITEKVNAWAYLHTIGGIAHTKRKSLAG